MIERLELLEFLGISKRSFKVWHANLSSRHSDLTSGYLLGTITNYVLQSYYHIVDIQWK